MYIAKNLMRLGVYLCILLLFYSCRTEMPMDFAIYAEYGLARTKKVNSYNNTFTFRTGGITDSVVIKFRFSHEELEQLWKLVNRYSISEYDSYYIPKDEFQISPDESYFLRFRANGIEHQIIWDTSTSARDRKSKRLRLVFKKIKKIVARDSSIAKLKYDFQPL
jgi:hypothetical protein